VVAPVEPVTLPEDEVSTAPCFLSARAAY
jgi:hypothetical protein